jgi:hypothetical protein
VGKLSDQSIENLIYELDKVSHDQNEGIFLSKIKIEKHKLLISKILNEFNVRSSIKYKLIIKK